MILSMHRPAVFVDRTPVHRHLCQHPIAVHRPHHYRGWEGTDPARKLDAGMQYPQHHDGKNPSRYHGDYQILQFHGTRLLAYAGILPRSGRKCVSERAHDA
jgi:hypothetical protein